MTIINPNNGYNPETPEGQLALQRFGVPCYLHYQGMIPKQEDMQDEPLAMPWMEDLYEAFALEVNRDED